MADYNNNVSSIKSKAFALRCIRLRRYLMDEKREYDLSKQLVKSGTSIGANIREAQRAQSKADFIAKMNIALKEADESAYWLELLHDAEYINDKEFKSLYNDCEELLKILTSIIKTSKNCVTNK